METQGDGPHPSIAVMEIHAWPIHFGQVTQNWDNNLLVDADSTTWAEGKWVPVPFNSDIYETLKENYF